MKKFVNNFLGIFISLGFKEDYKKIEREQNSSFTVIFMSSESYDNNNDKSYPCAQPIVVYVNGKYIEPPDCIKNDNGELINNNNTTNGNVFLPNYSSEYDKYSKI